MLEKGHPDLDYHFVIDRRGHVFKGRSAKFRGDTQTDYAPTGHLLVCCEGDYQGANGAPQKPTKAMLRHLGLPAGECRPPMGPTPEGLEERAAALLDALGGVG